MRRSPSSVRIRPFALPALVVLLASCAAVLGLPDPTLDDTIPVGGGSSSGASSSSGSNGDGGSGDGSPLDDAASDAPPDAPMLSCARRTPWTVTTIATPDAGSLLGPSLTDDELTMYYELQITPDEKSAALAVVTRGSIGSNWNSAGPVFVAANFPAKTSPCITPDGGTLFFSAGPVDPSSIFAAQRLADGGFGTANVQTGLNADAREYCRTVTPDGRIMYLSADNGTQANPLSKIYMATRVADGGADDWTPAVMALGLNDGSVPWQGSPVVRRDGMEIFFAQRNQVGGEEAIYTATLNVSTRVWENVTLVTELGSATFNRPGWLSPDGCRLYLARGTPAAGLSLATRTP